MDFLRDFLRRTAPVLLLSAVFFGIGVLPAVWPDLFNVALYYGYLLFASLLAGSGILLFVVTSYSVRVAPAEKDHRIVSFGLRVAVILAIGAIAIAVMFALSVLELTSTNASAT